MRKKLFGKLLSVALSATMAVTSAVPAYAAVDTDIAEEISDESAGDVTSDPGAPEAVEEKEETDEEKPESKEPAEEQVEEEAPVEGKTPGEKGETPVEEAAEEEAAEEAAALEEAEEEEIELEDYEDVTVALDSTAGNAEFVSVNGGVANVISSPVKVTSDEDYEFYVVPKVGYNLANDPVTIVGQYQYTPENGTLKTVDIKKDTDWKFGDVDQTDVTDGSQNPELVEEGSGSFAADKYNWSGAKKITINGSTEFLKGYAAAGSETNDEKLPKGKKTVNITVTAAAVSAAKYSLPVYSSETIDGKTTYTQITGDITDYKLTYFVSGSDNISAYIDDWTLYDEEKVVPAILKKDLSGVDSTATYIKASSADDVATKDGSNTNNYYYDASKHTMTVGKYTSQTGYIYNKKSGSFLAIIIPKKAAATKYNVTAINNSVAKFTIAETDKSVTKGTDIKIYKAASAGESSVAYTHDATHRAYSFKYKIDGGNTYTAQAKNSGGNDESTFDDISYWLIDGSKIEGDVKIYADTQEKITINQVDSTGNLDKTNHVSVGLVDNISEGTRTYSVDTDKEFKFTVNPVLGYELNANSVKAKIYNAAGTAISSTVSLTKTDGYYSINKVSSYVVIEILPVQIVNSASVKLSKAVTGLEITDAATKGVINSEEKQYAKLESDYSFRITESVGYQLKSGSVSATVGGETATVTYDESKKVYTIANVGGPIVITAEAEACLDITKIKNTDAQVTINGAIVGDGKSAKISAESELDITITALNGATIKAVWAVVNNDIRVNSEDTKGIKLEGTDDVYSISKSDIISATGKASKNINLYVETTRNASLGTDFTANFVADNKNVNNGITLYAGGATIDDGKSINDASVNTVQAVAATFTLENGSTIEADSWSMALKETYDEETKAEIEEANKTKYIATVTSGTITTEAKYKGGETVDSMTDVLTASAKVATAYPQSITYKATMNVTVLPLRSYYDSIALSLTVAPTTEGLAEKTIRVDDGTVKDEATYIIKGYKGADDENGTQLKKTTAASGVVVGDVYPSWKTTPAPGTASATATYKLNSAATNEVTADEAVISAAKKAQPITINGTVTFADGTKATASDILDVVGTNYGYFAIPVSTVNETSTYGTANITLETDGSLNSATVQYNVYHALTATGRGYLSTHSLTNATSINEAIVKGDVESVDASDVNWTSLTSTTEGYANYITISDGASPGNYTIAAKATHTAMKLKLAAKVGNYDVVIPTGSVVTVNVIKSVAKYAVTISLADADGSATKYQVPKFVEDFEWITKYTSVKTGTDAQDKLVLTNVPSGTKLKLPGKEAFTGIDPKRSIYGWSDGASTYYKVGDEVEVKKAENLVALWAPKFSSSYANSTKDTKVLRGLVDAKNTDTMGKINVINGNTNAAFTDPTNLAKGSTIPVKVSYYPLDLSVKPSAFGPCYAESNEVVIVSTGITLTAPDADSAKVLGGDGTSTTIPDATLTGAMLTAAGQPVTPITVKYSEGTDAEYDGANIVNVNVVNTTDTWDIKIADIEVGKGQTKKVTETKVTKDGVDTIKLNDESIAKGSVKITAEQVNGKDIVELSVSNAGNNEITVKGLEVGETTATIKFFTKQNKEVSKTFNVKVAEANVNIVVKITPTLTNSNETVAATTVADGETAWVRIGTGLTKINVSAEDTNKKTVSSATWNLKFKDTETDAETGAVAAGAKFVTGNGVSTTSAEDKITATALGSSELTIKATVNGDTYERVVPVATYSVLDVCGPKSSNKISGDITDDKAFEVYAGAEKVSKDKISYIPVKYDAAKTLAGAYEITEIANYSANWINESITQTFLGWNWDYAEEITSAKAKQTEAFALAGKTVKVTPTNAAKDAAVYAYFKDTALTVSGYPEYIELSDELVDSTGAKTDKDYTNWGSFDIKVEPANSTSKISISASETKLLDIAAVGDNTTNATAGKTANGLYKLVLTGTPVATGQWDGSAALPLKAKSGEGSNTYNRYDSFAIGKFADSVGTVELYITANGEKVATIPVYLNGEYPDATTPTIKHYMYRGEVQKNKSFTVSGKKHFYDADGNLVQNGSTYVESEGKYVLIIDGSQVTEAGLTTGKDGKKYLVQEDGYLFTSGITKVDGLNRLFREDGSIVNYIDSDVDATEHTITVGNTTYVIASDNQAEEDKLFEKESAVWAWKKASDGKTYASATVTFTSKEGKTKEFTVLSTDETAAKYMKITPYDGYTEYTVYASFKSKDTTVDATETKYLDADGNEYVPHSGEHAWTPSWTWAEDYSTASVTFVCTKGSEPEYRGPFAATISSSTAGTLVTYVAKYTFEEKEYSDSKAVIKKADGTETKIDDGTQAETVAEKGLYVEGIYDRYYNGSAHTFANIRAYWFTGDEQVLLVQGTDYTVKYANNTNAGKASVTLTGKGQYANLFTATYDFIIEPYDLDDIGTYSVSMLTDSKVAIPNVKFAGKQLSKIASVTFEDSSMAVGQKATKAGTFEATAKATDPNFTGSISMYYVVGSKTDTIMASSLKVSVLEKATITKDESGEIVAPTPKFSVRYGSETVLSTDENFSDKFEVYWSNHNAGTGYIYIVPKEDCTIGGKKVVGEKTQKFTIAGTKLSTVKSAFDKLKNAEVPYTGNYWTLENVLECLKIYNFASTLVEYEDYVVTCKNSLKKGTMTITFTGRGIYTGTVSESVKIRALNKAVAGEYDIFINSSEYSAGANELIKVPYTAGGAIIENLQVYALDGYMLREGVDYTLSYKNNKTVGSKATVTINGKGNYGKIDVDFEVAQGDTELLYTVPVEVTAASKMDGKKTPVVYDSLSGKKLTAGKDFTWTYGEVDTETGEMPVILKNGSDNTYDFGEDGLAFDGYHVYQTAISSKILSVKTAHSYTGMPITLGADDFGGGLKLDEDFAIVGYKNNIKSGTAKVIVKGLGKYGKTATINFKIDKFSGK